RERPTVAGRARQGQVQASLPPLLPARPMHPVASGAHDRHPPPRGVAPTDPGRSVDAGVDRPLPRRPPHRGTQDLPLRPACPGEGDEPGPAACVGWPPTSTLELPPSTGPG